jgi:spore coat polysaccharide biosynthesis protein SpsF
VVVATTTTPQDDEIERLVAGRRVPVVRGPTDDVLARFLGVLAAYPCDAAVRVTADCPLVDPGAIRDAAGLVQADEADYVGTGEDWPRGLGCEGFRVSALRAAADSTSPSNPADAPFREHVTLWLYRHPRDFRIRFLPAPPGFARPPPRLTLDEQDDFLLLQAVFREPWGSPGPSTAELVSLFRREPALASMNAHVRQKQV